MQGHFINTTKSRMLLFNILFFVYYIGWKYAYSDTSCRSSSAFLLTFNEYCKVCILLISHTFFPPTISYRIMHIQIQVVGPWVLFTYCFTNTAKFDILLISHPLIAYYIVLKYSYSDVSCRSLSTFRVLFYEYYKTNILLISHSVFTYYIVW